MFSAGVARPVPEHLIAACLAAGCYYAAEGPPPTPETMVENDPNVVSALQEACDEILTRADPALLTLEGIPRRGEVRKILPNVDFTPAEFDAAWAQVGDSGED